MTEATWVYRDGDAESAPLTLDALATLVRTGVVDRDTDLRRDAEGDWRKAADAAPELFDDPLRAPSEATSVGSAWTDSRPHPWRRYAARGVDNLLVGVLTWGLIGIVFYAAAPEQANGFFGLLEQPGGNILDLMLTLLAALPGNAVMVGLTGLSIGKWIFGVRVLKDGRPIGVPAALRRELSIWMRGLAFGIPFASLFTLYRSYKALTERRITAWDKAQGLTVVHRRESPGTTAAMWIAVILYLAAAWGVRMLAAV